MEQLLLRGMGRSWDIWNPFLLFMEEIQETSQLETFGWMIFSALRNGRKLIQEIKILLQEFITQQVFVEQEQQMEWWLFLEGEELMDIL